MLDAADLRDPGELDALLRGLTPAQRAELDALINGSAGDRRLQHLLDFCEEETPTWMWRWRYQYHIADYFERLKRRAIDRMMVFVPPRHGKSELLTIRGTANLIDRDPTTRVIIGAHSQPLANRFSRRTRRILRERGHELSREASAVDDWELTAGGGGRYAGIMGGVTGAGADAVGIDDPVRNRREAESEAFRDIIYEAYTDDFQTRLEPGGIMWLIMTRWHEDDLAGRILASEEGGDWAVVHLPALADDDDPLGRAPGEALCPDRYDERKLHRIKRIMRDGFEALYQGRPVAAEGGIIKRSWIRYYREPEPPEKTTGIVQSWDTAVKAQEIHDWSVCTTWAQTLRCHQLRDVWRERVEYPALRRAIIEQAEAWNPDAILIEDKATGQAVIQELRDTTRLPVVPVEPEGDKQTRMSIESSWYASGLIEHPAHAPWLHDLERELTTYPYSTDDDQVDSVSQYLRWAKARLAIITHASAGARDHNQLAEHAHEAAEIDAETGWGRLTRTTDLGGY